MSTRVKNPHYVWAYYLRAWEIAGRLWCYRGRDKRTFRTQSTQVAKERAFYQPQELTEADITVLHRLIERASDPRLRDLNRGWIMYNQVHFAAKRLLDSSSVSAETSAKLSAQLETARENSVEQWHVHLKQRFLPDLEALRVGNAEFYGDPVRGVIS